MFETEKTLTALRVGWWQETRLKGVNVKGKLVLMPSSLPMDREREITWINKDTKGFWIRLLGTSFCLCHSFNTNKTNHLFFTLVLSDLPWHALSIDT